MKCQFGGGLVEAMTSSILLLLRALKDALVDAISTLRKDGLFLIVVITHSCGRASRIRMVAKRQSVGST